MDAKALIKLRIMVLRLYGEPLVIAADVQLVLSRSGLGGCIDYNSHARLPAMMKSVVSRPNDPL